MKEQAHLELTRVSIDFPTDNGPFRALDNVNLKIDEGEFISLIGHSGCGKSTVLNIVAGLHRATEGGAILNGKEVTEPGPERAGGSRYRTVRGVSDRRLRTARRGPCKVGPGAPAKPCHE